MILGKVIDTTLHDGTIEKRTAHICKEMTSINIIGLSQIYNTDQPSPVRKLKQVTIWDVIILQTNMNDTSKGY
jgi:hypothetical protein